MFTTNLFLMSISRAGSFTGVDRYLQTLTLGLQSTKWLNIHRINFIEDCNLLSPVIETQKGITSITIPLPVDTRNIITEKHWMAKYGEYAMRILEPYFNSQVRCLVHIHTLNLFELASLLRLRYSCKIVTHLHCIPWKGLYNTNKKRFNYLYNLTYNQNNKNALPTERDYAVNYTEIDSYISSDVLVCVTKSGAEFVQKNLHIDKPHIHIVPNGLNDVAKFHNRDYSFSDKFVQCLFVGSLIESKGLTFVLEAIREVQKAGYKVSLTIVGGGNSFLYEKIRQENKDLRLNVLKQLSFNELQKIYAKCDLGIIASLQEQASYVAIEMAMFGLPIITTNVDGLGEMFTDEQNALSVTPVFSPVFGLSLDISLLCKQIVRLIESHDLREFIGKNARRLYETELNLQLMIDRTIKIYKDTL